MGGAASYTPLGPFATKGPVKIADKVHTPAKKIKKVVLTAGASRYDGTNISEVVTEAAAQPADVASPTSAASGSTRHGTPGETPSNALSMSQLGGSG